MKSYLKIKDFSISQEDFELHYNQNLDMLVTVPEPKDLEKYYESDVYISHTDSKETIVDKIYQTVKNYSLRKKIALLNSLNASEKTLLDIGAGTGDFLVTAKNNNWYISGVEPNAVARNKAATKGVELHESLDQVLNKKYDVITLWHVLEHLPDLEFQIKQITSLLAENGTLIIAVPNFKSYDATYYKKYWAAFDVPRHLWHFSKTTIEKLFQKHNMKLIKTKPMLFDSFYVSLLSEKYKNQKQNFLKAFYIGLLSNIKAIRSKEYSSHIYILKKRV